MAAPEVTLKNAPDTKIKLRNPVTVLLLDLVTIGIYGLFWWYYVNREMAELGRAKGTTDLGTNPMNSVLAIFPGALIIVPAIITMINTGKRVKAAQRLAGRQEEANEWIGLLLLLVFAPVGSGTSRSSSTRCGRSRPKRRRSSPERPSRPRPRQLPSPTRPSQRRPEAPRRLARLRPAASPGRPKAGRPACPRTAATARRRSPRGSAAARVRRRRPA